MIRWVRQTGEKIHRVHHEWGRPELSEAGLDLWVPLTPFFAAENARDLPCFALRGEDEEAERLVIESIIEIFWKIERRRDSCQV